MYVEWKDLDRIFKGILTALLKRDVEADSKREEFYYWGIDLTTPISKDEIEIIYTAADACDYDREANEFGEYPIQELCEGLCNKLMSKILPFTLDMTRADDGGVWFIGELRTMVYTKKRKFNDINEHSARVDKDIEKLRAAKDLTSVMYGKCLGNHVSGYFVQVYSNNPDEVDGMGFNTYTKAGAKHFANLIGESLGIPVESDWD
jgi:hypothetical protein